MGGADSDGAAAQAAGTEFALDDAVAYAPDEPPAAAEPIPAKPSGDEVQTLTKRERQVAELIAEGLSNREIAARLVIAQRTAEGHVDHILRKLDCTSRTANSP